MTKPKERNKVTKLTITLGTRELYFTLDEAKLLQKILNDTLVQPPVVSWGYYEPQCPPNYPIYGYEVTWTGDGAPPNLNVGNCTTTSKQVPTTNTI